MKKSLVLPAMLALASAPVHAVDFTTEILPIFKEACYKCHSLEEKKSKGNFALDDMKKIADAIAKGKLLVPGDAEKSSFYQALISPVDADGHMPPKKTLEIAQLELIKTWINEGAKFTAAEAPAPGTPAAPAAAAAPPVPEPPKAPALTPGQMAGLGPETAWTSADGRSIQAAFVELNDNTVTLRRADGLIFTVPLDKLSEASQIMAHNGGQPPQ